MLESAFLSHENLAKRQSFFFHRAIKGSSSHWRKSRRYR